MNQGRAKSPPLIHRTRPPPNRQVHPPCPSPGAVPAALARHLAPWPHPSPLRPAAAPRSRSPCHPPLVVDRRSRAPLPAAMDARWQRRRPALARCSRPASRWPQAGLPAVRALPTYRCPPSEPSPFWSPAGPSGRDEHALHAPALPFKYLQLTGLCPSVAW